MARHSLVHASVASAPAGLASVQFFDIFGVDFNSKFMSCSTKFLKLAIFKLKIFKKFQKFNKKCREKLEKKESKERKVGKKNKSFIILLRNYKFVLVHTIIQSRFKMSALALNCRVCRSPKSFFVVYTVMAAAEVASSVPHPTQNAPKFLLDSSNQHHSQTMFHKTRTAYTSIYEFILSSKL